MNIQVKLEQIRFSYEKKEILKGIDANFQGPGMYGIFGPNGSGKTTLLKCCMGLLRPQAGKVWVQEKPLKQMNYRERSRQIAYVPQEHQLSFPFTVQEVVLMGRTPYLGGMGSPKKSDVEAADMAMDRIGILHLKDQAYTQLSGGQRQLVLLARAVAQDTPVVILDEPASALDFKNQLLVFEMMREMAQKGKLVIACTHDPNHVKWFCDQALILKDGKILSFGPVEETMNQTCLEQLYGTVCMLKDGMIIPAAALR